MADAPRPLGSQPLPPHPPVADSRLAAATDSGPKGDARSVRLAKLRAPHAGGQTGGAARRSHPSRSARTVALVTSLLATGGVAAALAAGDRGAGDGMTAAAPGRAASASPDAGTSSPASPSASSASGSAASAAVTPSSSGSRDGTYTGEAEWTRWGYVQVKVTISNGTLTDVAAVQIPSGGKSSRINAAAQPILEQEAIAQQDADLDIVSGATYTSRTYAASLQAALDQAAMTAMTTPGQP